MRVKTDTPGRKQKESEALSYLQMSDHGISHDHASQYLLISFSKHTNQTPFDSFSLENLDSCRGPQGLLPILLCHSSVKAAIGSLSKWAMCCIKTSF